MTFLINYRKPQRNTVLEDLFSNSFINTFYDAFDANTHSIPVKVKEETNSIEISAPLAGFKKEQIEINVEKGYLTLTAKSDEKDQSYQINEYATHSLSRTLYVGDVDQSQAEAKFENGVLSISLPKSKEALQKNINIS